MKKFFASKSSRFTILGILLIGSGLGGSVFGSEEEIRLIGSCLAGLGIGWLIAAVGWSILT